MIEANEGEGASPNSSAVRASGKLISTSPRPRGEDQKRCDHVTSIDLTKTPSFRLDGRRALVTGGGRGIGLAAASALAEAGAHVTLAARTKTEIEEAAAAIRARGEKADALVLDVTDVEAVRAPSPPPSRFKSSSTMPG